LIILIAVVSALLLFTNPTSNTSLEFAKLEIASLKNNYTALQNQYQALQSQYNSLQDNHNSLKDQYNNLNNTYWNILTFLGQGNNSVILQPYQFT
jgi:FtsZ-binding cell division protein ZapB